jgi:hypothetical protein
VSEDEAQRLLDQVKELEDVRFTAGFFLPAYSQPQAKMPFNITKAHGDTFLQAWIGLGRKYSSAPFVSAGRMQKKPALDKGIKNLMQILDRSFAKAATYLRKVDEPT